jgi:hypothetical protein
MRRGIFAEIREGLHIDPSAQALTQLQASSFDASRGEGVVKHGKNRIIA